MATVFTCSDNEADDDADGLIREPDFDIRLDDPDTKHTREKLDGFIDDYNEQFGTKFSTREFYAYYKDVGRRVKSRDRKDFKQRDRIDILLVVNMFLTGFDAKKVNTLYVDKNLKFHGLVQAYSRTNRILGSVKSQGNIVCFRALKQNTDDAITLYSNKNASEIVLLDPYEDYVDKFNEGVAELLAVAPTVDSVNGLYSEDDIVKFVQAFRELMRNMNVLKTFSEFKFDDLNLDAQLFEDYKSKYLDIYDSTHGPGEPGDSIVQDLDFELELIHRDEINVAYILRLLAALRAEENSSDASVRDKAAEKKKGVLDLLSTETQLRSKRKLIEQFISENIPKLSASDDVVDAFRAFWDEARTAAFKEMCAEEGLKEACVVDIVDQYHFNGHRPGTDQICGCMETKPKILERKTVVNRVIEQIIGFVETFEDDLGEV